MIIHHLGYVARQNRALESTASSNSIGVDNENKNKMEDENSRRSLVSPLVLSARPMRDALVNSTTNSVMTTSHREIKSTIKYEQGKCIK